MDITNIPLRIQESDKIEIILRNIIKMLSKRVIFKDENDVNDTGTSILSNKKGVVLTLDQAYELLSDKGDNTYTLMTAKGEFAIKILFQNIASSAKGSIIRQFLDDYEDYMKIVVVTKINSKTLQIPKNKLQFFEENRLMNDITEHIYQPKFVPLNKAQKEKVFKEYKMTPLTCQRFESIDPIVHYYDLKKNDMMKIIRASPLSCLEPAFRILYQN